MSMDVNNLGPMANLPGIGTAAQIKGEIQAQSTQPSATSGDYVAKKSSKSYAISGSAKENLTTSYKADIAKHQDLVSLLSSKHKLPKPTGEGCVKVAITAQAHAAEFGTLVNDVQTNVLTLGNNKANLNKSYQNFGSKVGPMESSNLSYMMARLSVETQSQEAEDTRRTIEASLKAYETQLTKATQELQDLQSARAADESGKGGKIDPGDGGKIDPGDGGKIDPGDGGKILPGDGGKIDPGGGGKINPLDGPGAAQRAQRMQALKDEINRIRGAIDALKNVQKQGTTPPANTQPMVEDIVAAQKVMIQQHNPNPQGT